MGLRRGRRRAGGGLAPASGADRRGPPADEGTDDDADDREVHRTALGVLERRFGLSLPRQEIVGGALPAVLLAPA
ncbi:hypothetical protein [Streptomyces vinaceus]|uniref:hypothetical protein n=1 Tax=Streptomyces vinaceus TaxID=1960 RepID=UPI003828A4BC